LRTNLLGSAGYRWCVSIVGVTFRIYPFVDAAC
jgi:hypothetical protein